MSIETTTTSPAVVTPTKRRTKPSRLLRRVAAVAGVAVLSVGIGAATVPAGAANCRTCDPGGGGGGGTGGTAPTVTTIYSMSPGYGWSGDSVHISGANLLSASVTITSQDPSVRLDGPPSITSDTNTDLWFNLPTIHSTTVGPVSLNFHVGTPKGTVDASFALSPALHAAGNQTFMNSSGGQDGVAWATADVNRTTGTVTGYAHVENDQFWSSLSVNISVVWLDAQNRVIGFTAPQNVTVLGNYTLFGQVWTSGPITSDGPLGATVIGPNAGAGPWIHSAQVVLERDHLQELTSTLTTAWQTAQTMDFVWSHLPHP
jgi:hypothetical protein